MFEADGDGKGSGHDNAVMAEAVHMDGAPFAIWRGWDQHDHFHVTCSQEVLGWLVAFFRDGTEPPAPQRRRRWGGRACRGLAKSRWHAEFRESGLPPISSPKHGYDSR